MARDRVVSYKIISDMVAVVGYKVYTVALKTI
jgi:hypothetical protein